MATSIQERKLNRHFELLDLDKNGFIEQSDISEFCERIVDAADADGTPEARTFQQEGDRLWQKLQQALDADGDHRISRDEFVSAADINAVMNEAIKLGTASFEVIDTNHDGRISQDEWLRMDQKLGIARPDSMKGFEAIDKDGDGFVSKAEYARGVEEFYRSDDPSAPGNFAFGKF